GEASMVSDRGEWVRLAKPVLPRQRRSQRIGQGCAVKAGRERPWPPRPRPLSGLLRRGLEEGGPRVGQRLAFKREQVAGKEEAGQPEGVGDLLGARPRIERRVVAQEGRQRQEPLAPRRPGVGADRSA